MANKKFSEFTAASEIKDAGYFVGVQDGGNVKYPNTLLPSGGGGLPYTSYVAKLNFVSGNPSLNVEVYNDTGKTFTFDKPTTGRLRISASGDIFDQTKTVLINTGVNGLIVYASDTMTATEVSYYFTNGSGTLTNPNFVTMTIEIRIYA